MHLTAGDRINLVIDEPWDLVTLVGSGPLAGSVVAVDQTDYRAAILRLDQPIAYQRIVAQFFLAPTRLKCVQLIAGSDKGTAVCNRISLTDDEARSGEFRDPDSLEDRLLLIGDVSWTSVARNSPVDA